MTCLTPPLGSACSSPLIQALSQVSMVTLNEWLLNEEHLYLLNDMGIFYPDRAMDPFPSPQPQMKQFGRTLSVKTMDGYAKEKDKNFAFPPQAFLYMGCAVKMPMSHTYSMK